MNYKISVIIPCYSVGTEFVEEAIESIQNQTYSNWEIVFVDDCSPLQEWKSEKLNSIPKEKLKIINNKENLYAAQSRNIGFENSTGDIILFLDADDKYTSNTFFEYLINKFNSNANLDLIVYKWYRGIAHKKDFKLNNFSENFFKKASMQDYVTKFWFVSPCLQAMKKIFLKKNNIKFLNNRNYCEDWIYCYQIFTSQPDVISTNALFYFYRERKNSSSSNFYINNKFYEIKLINSICKDLIRLETIRGGGTTLNLLSNESNIWFLSRPLMTSIFNYGLKRNNKKILFFKIHKQYKKRIFYLISKCDFKYFNLAYKYKILWIYSLVLKILWVYSFFYKKLNKK